MARRLVSIDRETPMLMPPAIQDWVAEDDMARFVVEAAGALGEENCSFNWRGSGSEQYPPHMMLALLIYCYANGVFSSRKIERATHRDVAVRFIAGDTHPDHDTISTFRRENRRLFQACFVKVLEVAAAMKIRRVGEVALDGSVLEANASKKKVISQKELSQQALKLEEQVKGLLERADQVDAGEARSEDGSRLPAELVRAQNRRSAIRQAMETLKEQKSERAAKRERERAEFDQSGPGEPPKALEAQVAETDTINLTDPQARLLPQKKGGYAPGYNVQIAVQADTRAPLILAACVCDESNDRRQVEPMVEKIVLRQPETQRVVVDTGYDNSAQIFKMEQKHGVPIYCPPEEKSSAAKAPRCSKSRKRTAEYREGMRACMQSGFGKISQRLRATTVEPVIGWIKTTMGFRRFHLRGMAKVGTEWDLVCLAFNFQLLNRLLSAQKAT